MAGREGADILDIRVRLAPSGHVASSHVEGGSRSTPPHLSHDVAVDLPSAHRNEPARQSCEAGLFSPLRSARRASVRRPLGARAWGSGGGGWLGLLGEKDKVAGRARRSGHERAHHSANV